MDVKLISGDVARIMRKAFKNPEALESYYRGEILLWGTPTRPKLHEAQRLIENSINLEPNVSAGYAAAALAHWVEVISGLSDNPDESLDRAMELARKAIQLEDVTGYSHLLMAYVHLRRREFDEAMIEVTRAVSDRPSCPGAYALKAGVLNYLGRPVDAIEFAEYALRLTPVHPPMYPAVLATAYYGSDRHDEAITATKTAIALDEQQVDPYLIMAASNTVLGHSEAAQQTAQKVLELKPDFNLTEFAASQPYKEQEHLDRLLAHLTSAGLE